MSFRLKNVPLILVLCPVPPTTSLKPCLLISFNSSAVYFLKKLSIKASASWSSTAAKTSSVFLVSPLNLNLFKPLLCACTAVLYNADKGNASGFNSDISSLNLSCSIK